MNTPEEKDIDVFTKEELIVLRAINLKCRKHENASIGLSRCHRILRILYSLPRYIYVMGIGRLFNTEEYKIYQITSIINRGRE